MDSRHIRDSEYMFETKSFALSNNFLEEFKGKQPEWGPLGYITYKRTYARELPEGGTEEYWQTVARVINGVFTIQKQWCKQLGLPWSDSRAQKTAQKMYRKMWEFKMLAPGRGLWIMGTDFIEKHGSAALNNCAFASTEDIDIKYSKAFEFLMDMSMLGVGVGFDTLGAGKVTIKEPKENGVYVIPDSREGWVESLKKLLDAYFLGKPKYTFDYSLIRPEGSPIKGFGGLSAGPEPLRILHVDVDALLAERIGQPIKSTDIVDIMNMIGRCVVAGNVRRCLPEGTLIHTKEGLVRIENILPGMLAKTSTGYAEISELIPQGKQKTIAIKTQLGIFECTGKHRVAKMTGVGKYSWVMAKDLKKGDRLTFIDSGIDGEETSLPEFKYEKSKHSTTCKDISIPKLDSDMAWFLGLFHGDGYTYPNYTKNGFNAYVSVACSPEYPKIIEDCQKQFRRFGVALCDTLPSAKDKSHKVRAQSKQLSWYLSTFKQANTSISIPDFIQKGTQDIRAAYVMGLFDSDGGKHNRPIIAASSVYPEYLSEVQAIYASLGIPTRIKMHRKPVGVWKALYHLTIVGEKTKKDFFNIAEKYSRCFKDIIKNVTTRSQNDFGFPSDWVRDVPFGRTWDRNSKQMTLSCLTACGVDYKNMVPVEVLEISENDIEVTTYDISVPGKKEFVCQAGLLVHNSAEIALGKADDIEFLTMKQDLAKLESHRWASNNSILAHSNMDYSSVVESVWKNGEPGLVWLENAQKYGRLKDGINWLDKHAKGVNPCGEQTLESFELCCLVETFPSRHESYEEFEDTLKMAYLYGKSVTLVNTHWAETNAVMLKNRRMGISQTGIINAIGRHGLTHMLDWCDKGYNCLKKIDELYSAWLCVPLSKKLTTVKPSGTVSLLAGVSAGIHYPHSKHYIRRIRFDANSEYLPALRASGYIIEQDVYSANSVCVEFPVEEPFFTIGKNDVTVWEQLENAGMYQYHWSDNQVSITVTFKENEKQDLKRALEYFEHRLKSVSLLPLNDSGYKQMPYETITEEVYRDRVKDIKPLDLSSSRRAGVGERFCSNDVCEIKR